MRPAQWLKNLLIAFPVLISPHTVTAEAVTRLIIAFCAMSLCASAMYVVNDVADVASDSAHPSKRGRPFASQELPISAAWVLVPSLILAGIALSLLLPATAASILLIYVVLSLAYTFWFKQKLIADVLVVSVLNTMRILVGAAALSLRISPWLLAFWLFLLLSLAFSKRVTEITRCPGCGDTLRSRAYFPSDTMILANLGTGTGFLSCLMLTFCISAGAAHSLYLYPAWLWLLEPLLIYWIGRLWVLTVRGQIPDDLPLFLSKDTATYGTACCCAIVLWLAKNIQLQTFNIMQ